MTSCSEVNHADILMIIKGEEILKFW